MLCSISRLTEAFATLVTFKRFLTTVMFYVTNSLEHMVNNNFIRVPDASHVTYALHNISLPE